MPTTALMDRRLLIGSAGAVLAQALFQQARAQGTPPVFEHDLPDVEMKNWAVTVREVNYQPGGTSTPHRHPGITIVYVLEGEIRSKVGDGPEKTYGPGQMFMETPNELHAVSRNASDIKPAKFIALLLAEKGKPLTAPA
jgi:quercetin dioxygenase-like cupin family protein